MPNIEVNPSSAQVTTTTVVSVATNVCGDIPPTIPVNIDCSLCALGFPQYGGQISLVFYGPICPPSTSPSPSYWLGSALKSAQFKCPNPGMNAEPDPNKWVATGYFSSASGGGCAQQYKFIAELTALNYYQISVTVTVYVLTPTTGGATWSVYVTWSETLTELVGTDTTRYRGRMYQSPTYVPITVNQIGGKGDPVSYAKMIVGINSMRVGCDATGNAIPDTCGFWDGTQWLSCIRGFVRSNANTAIREFTQLGFNPTPCGGSGQQFCQCDSITLTSVSPPTGTTTYNTDAAFVTQYGVLGLPGGIEAVGARQQLQIARTTDAGIQIVVKQVNNGVIYICTNDNGAGWVISAAVVAQSKGPRILTASRSGFDVYLYALNFPNDNLLADSCSSGGQYPTPNPETDPYWCTPSGCVQSRLQPTTAIGGPYATLVECSTVCEEITPEDPYWCVDGLCVQSATEPEGSTGGPYLILGECEAECGASANYWCLYGNCVESATQPDPSATGPYATSFICAENCPGPAIMVYVCTDAGCGTIAKSGAIMGGYTYYDTLGECEAACPTQFWCVDDVCAEYWTGYTPPSYSAGPFSTIEECYDECDTGEGWYCLGGTCGFYSSRPPGATGPRSNSYAECVPNCFVFEPMLAMSQKPKEVPEVASHQGKVVRKLSEEAIKRIRLPCVHRGARIQSGFT